MRYVVRGLELRTENAAKPFGQGARWVLDWIAHLPRTIKGLDYGCGKFRYTIPLGRRIKLVYAVDSDIQINRVQTINNRTTTLQEYARRFLRNVRVESVSSSRWRHRKFDVILCCNVLSVIPERTVRVAVLRLLRKAIKPTGQILVCNQFRNTYFTAWEHDPNALRFRDGWLVRSRSAAYFYAIIPPARLEKLCIDARLSITRSGAKGESAFVFARA